MSAQARVVPCVEADVCYHTLGVKYAETVRNDLQAVDDWWKTVGGDLQDSG